MFKTYSPAAVLEMRDIQNQLEDFLKLKNPTRAECKRSDALVARLAALRDTGITDGDYQRIAAEEWGRKIAEPERRAQEAHEKLFEGFLRGKPDEELRGLPGTPSLLAGTQAVAFTAGPQGGVLVPAKFQQSVTLGLAATDPLLDAKVCDVIQENDFRLPPLQIPGWDLSTITATKVDEAAQHNADAVPSADNKLLNKFTYRVSLGASLEFEDDERAFARLMAGMGMAMGIGFARGIGADLVNGDGATGPSGILNGLSSVFSTATAGTVILADINEAFYAVNPIYRASAKCGWLMNDTAHEAVSNATDPNGRPLINVVNGVEMLKGKPIHITPSLPTSGAGSFCVFGDLDYFKVHVSTMWLRRSLQVPGYVENGKALYTGLMLCDAVLHDPTGGDMPPVICAALA